MSDTCPIDFRATVNEIVVRYPAVVPVLNRYGIDLCCGASASLEEAAHRDGVDPAALRSSLRKAIAVA